MFELIGEEKIQEIRNFVKETERICQKNCFKGNKLINLLNELEKLIEDRKLEKLFPILICKKRVVAHSAIIRENRLEENDFFTVDIGVYLEYRIDFARTYFVNHQDIRKKVYEQAISSTKIYKEISENTTISEISEKIYSKLKNIEGYLPTSKLFGHNILKDQVHGELLIRLIRSEVWNRREKFKNGELFTLERILVKEGDEIRFSNEDSEVYRVKIFGDKIKKVSDFFKKNYFSKRDFLKNIKNENIEKYLSFLDRVKICINREGIVFYEDTFLYINKRAYRITSEDS